jgi:putative methanogenesis marker protein 12
MGRTLGVDHGTQKVRFCLLEGKNRRFLELDRESGSKGSILKVLEKKGLRDVELIGLTYSMADAINCITNIKKVKDRGQTKKVTGELVGFGTRLFDEIYESELKAVLIPGLHRGIDCLDARFRLLYSHMAASEKVALSNHGYNEINRTMEAANIIISDVSSNTVSIGIKDGKFFGAIDACLGASGLIHGPLDLSDIRRIDQNKTTANRAFYSAGVSQKSGLNSHDIMKGETKEEKLALNSLIMAVKMEVAGLSSVINPQAIAIAGSAGLHKNVFKKLKTELENIAPVFRLDNFSAAIGAAEIARDVLLGRKDFLGIGVRL